ncbi:MAG: LytTR family DNA-binding domain-containing protein [Bacilli bacterium]|nr:LytTR family DNA-binding domain-containing protein [Bacilli bacterium]MDD4808895.1 LytTR family DNA-binding domain-containing protein [Bacilli bacterium]
MIEFVICDDDISVCMKVKNIITKVMMQNNQLYKTRTFNDYDDNFLNFIEKNTRNNIYILDIETKSRSGIDMARIIRKKDFESIIIFLTIHEELGPTILKNELLFLSFINKFDNAEERLYQSITKALELLNIKKYLKYEEKQIIYTIPLDNILYIMHDIVKRKTVIKTTSNSYFTYRPLVKLINMVDNRFIRTHRSCIVNQHRVLMIDNHKKIIIFDNQETINLLSNKYFKELKLNAF